MQVTHCSRALRTLLGYPRQSLRHTNIRTSADFKRNRRTYYIDATTCLSYGETLRKLNNGFYKGHQQELTDANFMTYKAKKGNETIDDGKFREVGTYHRPTRAEPPVANP